SAVQCLNRYVALSGQFDRGLEPGLGRFGHRGQRARRVPPEYAPRGNARAPVPAGINGRGWSAGRGSDGRRLGRCSAPQEPVGAIARIGVDEMPVHDQPPSGVEFGEVGTLTPAQEVVTARKLLDVALETRRERWSVKVLRHHLRGHVLSVEAQPESARLAMYGRRPRAVIEDRDELVA